MSWQVEMMDTSIFQFDIWETLDEESMELTQTSEFWNQVQYEADRLEIPDADFQNDVPECEGDWSILDTQEEPPIKQENLIHHDCMWAGSCVDSVHPTNTFVPSELIPTIPGQSLLRRDNAMSPPRPETPPLLDGDEPPQFRHAMDVAGTALRLLRDSAAVAADHSYTLARQNFDNLGVQTPSDSCESEEEIDVVSVGVGQQPLTTLTQARADSLPRAPSMQERHHIQRKVATAMHSRPAPRKRLVPPSGASSSGSGSGSGSGSRRRRGPGRRSRRANTDTESEGEAPELERRSIHNDMERQRRIGLKNLFDELKKQIPATRDKERAPKVVILREAASLCRKLREEDVEREALRKQQAKLLGKLKKLRALNSARFRHY